MRSAVFFAVLFFNLVCGHERPHFYLVWLTHRHLFPSSETYSAEEMLTGQLVKDHSSCFIYRVAHFLQSYFDFCLSNAKKVHKLKAMWCVREFLFAYMNMQIQGIFDMKMRWRSCKKKFWKTDCSHYFASSFTTFFKGIKVIQLIIIVVFWDQM